MYLSHDFIGVTKMILFSISSLDILQVKLSAVAILYTDGTFFSIFRCLYIIRTAMPMYTIPVAMHNVNNV